MVTINLAQGDITKLAENFDAIVNAANESLLGGGGVDGCIHRAAGPELLEECKTLNGCETGDAKITDAYNIPCKKIIHVVGPDCRKLNFSVCQPLLFLTYLQCFEIAKKNNLKNIALPSVSTGVYSFPVKEAAHIAFSAARYWETCNHNYDLNLTWVLFTNEDYEAYTEVLTGKH